jgi:dTDP-4-amino-4,6-dideoxygalactose transaminase
MPGSGTSNLGFQPVQKILSGEHRLKTKGLFAAENHPVTEHLATRGLYLTSGLNLTEQQIDEDSGVVRKVLT